MAHPDLESKERIIYKCCLNRVFLTVVDTIWYDASVEQTYHVYMTHRGKFPRPSRILWGCIFGPSRRLDCVHLTKINSWNIHPCRMVALSPRCSYTDPSTFVAFLLLPLLPLSQCIHSLYSLLPWFSQMNLCNYECNYGIVLTWYPETWDGWP